MRQLLVVLSFIPGMMLCQESGPASWNLRPTLSLVKFLPGKEVTANASTYQYSGTGLALNIRASHPDIPALALTAGTGVNWFYSTEDQIRYFVGETSSAGVGKEQKDQSFETFPVNAGIHVYFPGKNPDAFMGFLGVEGSVHFVDGNLDIGSQARLGYNVLGGFALKIFEMGIRYSSFSDVANIGVHFGLRLPAVQM